MIIFDSNHNYKLFKNSDIFINPNWYYISWFKLSRLTKNS